MTSRKTLLSKKARKKMTTKKGVVKKGVPRKKIAAHAHKKWQLKLYVAGQTTKSMIAFNNLKAICEAYLQGVYEIEIIDLLKNPQLAKGDQILAIPTLVRQLPQPIKKIIGDLSNTEKVLVGLNIKVKTK